MDPDCISYMHWATTEAGIKAPKVLLKDMTSDGKGRGLVANESIWPNELIMHVPARSMIGVRNFFQRDNDPVVKFIKTLIEMASGKWDWRDDDSIALFLIASLLSGSESESMKRTKTDTREDVRNFIPEAEAVIVESEEDKGNTCDLINTTAELVETSVYQSNACDTDTTLLSPSNVQDLDLDRFGESTIESRVLSFIPHVMMLPLTFSTPIYFEELELNRMTGINCRELTVRMKEQIMKDWNELHGLIGKYNHEQKNLDEDYSIIISENDFSPSLYCWALSIVYSRSTDFQKQNSDLAETENIRVIVPIFDMINHDFKSDVYHAMDENGDVRVFNGKNIISRGQEITLSYGNFSNEKLLFVYGFCLRNNPYNTVSIYAPLSPSDSLYNAKANLLKQYCGLNDLNEPHLLRFNFENEITEIPSTLFSTLRIIGVQSVQDFLKLSEMLMDKEKPSEIPMLSYENESSSLVALYSALQEITRLISLNLISDENLHAASSSQEDENSSMVAPGSESLAEDVESINLFHIKILNWSERQVLVSALNLIKERIDKLQ